MSVRRRGACCCCCYYFEGILGCIFLKIIKYSEGENKVSLYRILKWV